MLYCTDFKKTKKGVKPVTKCYLQRYQKRKMLKSTKDLGGITMIVKKKVKGIDEGKKRYYQQDRVGSKILNLLPRW